MLRCFLPVLAMICTSLCQSVVAQQDSSASPTKKSPEASSSTSGLPPGQGPNLTKVPDPEKIIDEIRRQHGTYWSGTRSYIIPDSSFPIRRGHGGGYVYDRAGRRIPTVEIPVTSSVRGAGIPSPSQRWGLLDGIRTSQTDMTEMDQQQSVWTGKGLRVVSDVHMLAEVSQPLFDWDPMEPINQGVEAIRNNLLSPISTTFQPMMAWTYQHATKVRDGYRNGRSNLFFAADGAVTLWDREDSSGRVVYNIQAAEGAFTAVRPYLATAVGSPMNVNNILVNSNFNLYMLYWHQELFDKKVRVSIGKIESQVFFDTNAIAYNPATQFMYEGFNQSITNPFPGYGFGGQVEWTITDDWKLRAATMNSETTSKSTGFEYLSKDHLFSIIESDLRLHFDSNDHVYEGHYRLMLWYKSIGRTSSGKSPWDASGWGVTFNMDQRLVGNLVTFCRVGWGENDVTSSNFSVSGGFGIENFLNRQGDCIGFAGSWSKLTELGRYNASLAADAGDQTFLEWFWRINMTDTIQVSPVIQYVYDSGAGIDGSLIWGIRSVWSF
ncbi:MAG: carbohydrate porin [Phycisphaerales bacterium]|nr:carbohydrate porin [Phycisphaerales bacterium]